MLIHVTFKVTGDPTELARFGERLRELSIEHLALGELDEQHTREQLWYDLKLDGGIPFPPFALASQEFPGLTVVAEWVDPGAGARGTATIVGGKVIGQATQPMAPARGPESVHIAVTRRGYVELAAAFIAARRDEYLGYVLNGGRDAVFRLTRGADGVVELDTTEGDPQWCRHWRIEPGLAQPVGGALDPAQPIPAETWRELEALAQRFVAEWMWFRTGPREEIAIEVDRYGKYGWDVSDANLRSSALRRIGSETPEGAERFEYSTVRDGERWVVAALQICWPGAA